MTSTAAMPTPMNRPVRLSGGGMVGGRELPRPGRDAVAPGRELRAFGLEMRFFETGPGVARPGVRMPGEEPGFEVSTGDISGSVSSACGRSLDSPS